MMPGGKAIIPLPPRRPSSLKNLLPTSLMAIWEYSDLSDTRESRTPLYHVAPGYKCIGAAKNRGNGHRWLDGLLERQLIRENL